MSVLIQDKKVLQEGRKAPLKNVKASLRDQIVKKLAKKLDDDDFGIKVRDLWNRGNANRAEWLERQGEYMAGWDEFLEAGPGGTFDGSSNLHLPTLFIVVKTMHARFLQALIGVDPPFVTKARTEASVDRVPMVSDTMRYAVLEWANHHQGIEEQLDKWVWSWVSTGSGIIKWSWDVEYTRYVDVDTVEKKSTPKFVIDPKTGKEIAIPQTKMVEEETIVTKKVFDGPTCHFVQVEDLLILGGSGNPDRADTVIEQSYLDSSALWTLADRGVFSEEVVREIIDSGYDSEVTEDTSNLKQQRATASGQGAADNDLDIDRYGMLEVHTKYDVDGSGIFSDIVAWVHKKTGKIAKATYLRRMTKSGERPYKKIDYHIRNGQEYGIGIVEILYPLAKEMDAMHNMRIDWGMVATMPFGFYRPASSINPETIQLEPGALIPVDNPSTDVYFPNLGNRTVFGMQEEQALQQMIDRVTSISDLNLGVISGQGATRTATGTKALVGESSANLDVYLRRLNRGWRASLKYLLHMLQQRVPAGLSFRVTGDTGSDYWQQIASSDDLAGDFDIEVSANSSNSNKQVQQDVAQQILQLVSNPLNIQLQIVSAGNVYEANKNYMQSLGIKEYGRYITKPQGYMVSMSPEEEANRLLRGIPVPVQPAMDHQGFVDFVEMLFKHDELMGQFTQQEVGALHAQAMQHQSMMSALASAQSQAANVAQMQQNAQQSSQQTNPGGPVGVGAGSPPPAPAEG
jgi:uncharacterized protein YwbE